LITQQIICHIWNKKLFSSTRNLFYFSIFCRFRVSICLRSTHSIGACLAARCIAYYAYFIDGDTEVAGSTLYVECNARITSVQLQCGFVQCIYTKAAVIGALKKKTSMSRFIIPGTRYMVVIENSRRTYYILLYSIKAHRRVHRIIV